MNEKWDLGILYGGFDDENFKADMSAFDESIKDVVELASKAENMTCDGLLKEYIGCMERYAYLAKKLYIFAYLRYNADTGDMQAMSVMNNIDAKMSGCAAADAKLNHIIASYDNLEKVINENAELAEFKYLFTTIKNDSKYLLGEREEEIFSYMDISGASAWEG
ncbi:MAG: hypothetical protein IJL87_02375, partial [Clostridia bacterium]|nr:hypothetical protein [Clostridia bacterium]